MYTLYYILLTHKVIIFGFKQQKKKKKYIQFSNIDISDIIIIYSFHNKLL